MIEVKNLSFAYEEKHCVLHDVSFSIPRGQFVSIIGHNGSGKSTLAKLLAGLIEVKVGSIAIDKVILNPSSIQSLRPKLGIVFQNPDNQFIGATVADDLAFGLENRCVPHDEMERQIVNVAKHVGMEGFLHQEPTSLSGGQKQRVAIAGVLAMQPEIMIFDEATAMLDPQGKDEIRRILMRMRQEQPNLTIILITHDLEEARLADRVIVLNQGQVVMDGTPSTIFTRVEELKSMSLHVPFLYQLIHHLPKDKQQAITSIEDVLKVLS